MFVFICIYVLYIRIIYYINIHDNFIETDLKNSSMI